MMRPFLKKWFLGVLGVLAVNVCFAALALATPLDDLCAGKAVYRTSTAAPAAGTFVLTLDNEDPCFTIESGAWTLNYSGSIHYFYNYYINGPGDGSARGAWVAEGLPWGNYTVEFWADNGNYARDAHYIVEHADGTTTQIANQYYVTGGWQPLGNFDFRGMGRVTLTDGWSSEGVRVLADALRFTLNGTPTAPTVDVASPRISLIIDDAGSENPNNTGTTTYKLLHLGRPMTIAVMPSRSYSQQVAQAAAAHGFQVVVHQPMQPISAADPGAGAIWAYMTDAQVLATVRANLDSIPEAAGMNNHMGSLITQDAHKIGLVVQELAARGLFYVDSRTVTTSVAYDVARDAAMLTGERDLFIDGNNKEEAKGFIRMLAEKALYAPNEPHIGIGHVRSATIDAISEMLPELDAMGVELLPVSKNISQALETDRQPQEATFSTAGAWTPTPDDLFSKELANGNALIAASPGTGESVSATFRPNLQYDAYYRVFIGWHEVANPAAAARVTIQCSGGTTVRTVDFGARPNDWHYLGRHLFRAGTTGYVTLDDATVTTPGQQLIVDGARWMLDDRAVISGIRAWMLY